MIPLWGGGLEECRKIKWRNFLRLRHFLDNTPRKSNVLPADEYLKHEGKAHLYYHGSKGPDREAFERHFNSGGFKYTEFEMELACFFHFFKNPFFSWRGHIFKARYHHGAEQQYNCEDMMVDEKYLGWRYTMREWLDFVGLPRAPFAGFGAWLHRPLHLMIATSVLTSVLTVLLMKLFGG